MRPATFGLVKGLIFDQTDRLESRADNGEINPLPYAPIKRVLKLNGSVLRLSHLLEIGAARTNLLAPLSNFAHSRLFKEFERGYDATVAYLLAHEGVLEERSHDTGTCFSLDAEVDHELEEAVKATLALPRTPTLAHRRTTSSRRSSLRRVRDQREPTPPRTNGRTHATLSPSPSPSPSPPHLNRHRPTSRRQCSSSPCSA